MIKHAGEIPVSYLNKGQAYALTIIDTMPTAPKTALTTHRTFIRISFEDEEQRSKPGACWQLWKDGRGTNEAHQREGRLLAVEYVDTSQGGDLVSKRPQVELEHNSFDGFCVTWSAHAANEQPQCTISVRFNFLSTDFSHSKGVKGIPVRLCSKTQTIPLGFAGNVQDLKTIPEHRPEVCYAKVKLFRDHGAERKLANDVAHVKKTIEKLKHQISQAEAGLPAFGKRRRSGSLAKAVAKGSGKVTKERRVWSLDQDGEAPSQNANLEEDLIGKLTTVQDMFSSTRPVSVLYLPGDSEDDPDLFPVRLSNERLDPVSPSRIDRVETKVSGHSTPDTSNAISPTLSSNTNISPNTPRTTFMVPSSMPPLPPSAPPPPPPPRLQLPSSGPRTMDNRTAETNTGHHSMSQYSIGVTPRQQANVTGGTIQAMDVDPTYQAPPRRAPKPGEFKLCKFRGQHLLTSAQLHVFMSGGKTLPNNTTVLSICGSVPFRH